MPDAGAAIALLLLLRVVLYLIDRKTGDRVNA